MFKKSIMTAALATSLLVSGSASAETKEINFGIISTESSTALKKTWMPFIDAMQEGTGVKVNAYFASDYAGVIEGMRFNKVQVAWFGNKSAMEAVDRSNGEVFAQTVDKNGNPGYWSLLVTNKDSKLNSVEDVLKCDGSLNFGIGDPNSTSGFLIPMTYVFAKNNVTPAKCFKTVRSANHQSNALAAANNLVDVATNNTESMARLKKTNPDAFAKIKVIWKSPLIPADPLVWRKDLDADFKALFSKFIMSYGVEGTEAEKTKALAVLADLDWAPFRKSSDAQLYPIRILAINKNILKTKADAKLSDAEKATKVKALEAESAKWSALAEAAKN